MDNLRYILQEIQKAKLSPEKDHWDPSYIQEAIDELDGLLIKIKELKEEVANENAQAYLYMNRMLEARENISRLEKAYSNTRQTLSNIGLGMLKGEDQTIAMNEVRNMDHVLATCISWCTCSANPLDENHLSQRECRIHGTPREVK